MPVKVINNKKIDEYILAVIVGILLILPLFLSDFRINLVGKYLTYAIAAIGIDMIWGYTGILSLGQGVFFGLGGYAMAMYLKLEASGGKLPDFMSWSGLTKIPWFWKPFSSPFFSIIMAVVIPTLLALFLGYLIFRNRIRGVYFSIFSQALSIIFVVLFVGQQPYTGGTNGITDYKTLLGFVLSDHKVKIALYYISLLFLIGTYLLCRYLVNGRLGKVLIAIRDGENRVRFSGYDPTVYKVFVYCFSAALAGIAGALYVPQVGIISPTVMDIVFSIEMVVWVAIGGRGTLVGPVIGAIVVNAVKSGISEKFPDIWSYFLGAVFIIVILLLPGGVMGLLKKFINKSKGVVLNGSKVVET